MKTISRRATKKIAAIRETHTVCHVHELDSGFVATQVPADAAWAKLDQLHFARLIDKEDGTLTIAVHGNLWFTLTKP